VAVRRLRWISLVGLVDPRIKGRSRGLPEQA